MFHEIAPTNVSANRIYMSPSLMENITFDVRARISIHDANASISPVVSNPSKQDIFYKQFLRLAKLWESETKHISSPHEKYLHPSYARIIGMGGPAIKLILQRMKKKHGDWFFALRALTGENPVTDEMAGDVAAMSKAWILWGNKKGIL